MSGSTNGAGMGGVVTVASGAAALPFTSGNETVSLIILTAIACGLLVILSKIIKRMIIHS